jgi:hypothetical protein
MIDAMAIMSGKITANVEDKASRAGRGEGLPERGLVDEVLAELRRRLGSDPDDPAALRLMAEALVMKGDLHKALPVCRRAAEKSPADREAHKPFAAIHFALGDKAQGRSVMRAHFRDHPLKPSVAQGVCAAGARPAILKIWGFDRTLCRLGTRRNKRPAVSFRGGHFTTEHLLAPDRHPLWEWTIAEDNINRRDDVPAYDLVLNTISDPDIEHDSLLAPSRYAKDRPGISIVNHPDRVLENARDDNFRRLDAIPGGVFPRTVRFARQGLAPAQATERIGEMKFDYPIIVRETGTHTARTVELICDDAALAGYFTRSDGTEFYVIQFVDERIGAPGGGERFYGKKRVFAIGGRLYPVVSHVDRVWNVHGRNRLTVMRNNRWMQEQEMRFLADPAQEVGAANYGILERLPETIGLDFFGIDFTVRRDGTLLIYELNASMRHSEDHARSFPYMRPHMARITEAFGAMIDRKLGF